MFRYVSDGFEMAECSNDGFERLHDGRRDGGGDREGNCDRGIRENDVLLGDGAPQ